ncbi:MAG: three-Cys-motif partner protein TcmP, partial [Dehalococcoidia bacterium]|nr:three-Cys-motif partner protein TcmP [Dehalococcoidia bacterium]
MTNPFFNEQAEQSLVKTQIVVKYFAAWAKVMKGQADKIGYLDFYAGPGRYASGEKSTPLLVLEQAISNPGLADKLVTVFNDIDP